MSIEVMLVGGPLNGTEHTWTGSNVGGEEIEQGGEILVYLYDASHNPNVMTYLHSHTAHLAAAE